jgi:cbb3-type cytochrome oxidase subunit 3
MLFMSKRDNQTWEIGYHKTYQNAVRLIVLIYIGYISSMYNAKGTIVVLS